MNIVTTRDVSYRPDQVWQVAAEQFATISDWSSGVTASRLAGELVVGGVRTCDLADGSTITETITKFDPANHAITYVVDSGLPPMVHGVENAFTITSIGDGKTRVTSVLTPNVKWWAKPMTPMMKRQFGKMMGGLLDDLVTEVGRQTADQLAN